MDSTDAGLSQGCQFTLDLVFVAASFVVWLTVRHVWPVAPQWVVWLLGVVLLFGSLVLSKRVGRYFARRPSQP